MRGVLLQHLRTALTRPPLPPQHDGRLPHKQPHRHHAAASSALSTQACPQTLELTHRLKEVRDREAGLLKETGTYRDQLERISKEKDALERRMHAASEQRDQAITDRAWLGLSLRALLRHAAIFALGAASAYAATRIEWAQVWPAPAHRAPPPV